MTICTTEEKSVDSRLLCSAWYNGSLFTIVPLHYGNDVFDYFGHAIYGMVAIFLYIFGMILAVDKKRGENYVLVDFTRLCWGTFARI